MNAQFLELAHRAQIEFTYDPTETPMRAFAECWADDLERFAESIVLECAEVGSKFAQAHPADLSYQIRRHFGLHLNPPRNTNELTT